jgi:hypothetical protein
MRVHSVQSSVSEEFYDQCEREFKLSPATDPAKRIGWLGWRTSGGMLVSVPWIG